MSTYANVNIRDLVTTHECSCSGDARALQSQRQAARPISCTDGSVVRFSRRNIFLLWSMPSPLAYLFPLKWEFAKHCVVRVGNTFGTQGSP